MNNLQQAIRDMIGHTKAAIAKERQFRQSFMALDKEAQAMVPEILDTLETKGKITRASREKLASYLANSNPKARMQAFLAYAKQDATADRYVTGEPVEKTASAAGVTTSGSGYGYSASSAQDAAFLEGFGL